MSELQSNLMSLFAARDRVDEALLEGPAYEARKEFLSEAETFLASSNDPNAREIVAAMKRDVESARTL